VILVSTILDEVAGILLDGAEKTWTNDEKLGYLNEAMRATSLVKADFYVVETSMLLDPGVKQNLPGDAVTLIDVPRNSYDNTGTDSGRVITQVDKGLLDEANRFWPAGTRETTVQHFTEDPRNPRRFVVFPPNTGEGAVDVIYGATPPQIMYATEELPVLDAYQAPLIDYVLMRCYSKNSRRQDLTKAASYRQSWGQALGMRSQQQVSTTPKVASEPGTTT
jgi:hypothetical protein